MKVFITGGTGYVGRHVIDALIREKHQVIVLVRDFENADPLIDRGLNVAFGDVLDALSLEKALIGFDAVIHLVGIIVEERGGATFEQMHFDATKNVVNTTKKAGIKKYIHMSALGAEKDALSMYHKTKYMAQEYVKESGLDYTIFKPSVIHGPGDAFVNMYARMLKRSPLVPVIGNGRVRMQPVYVKDIADMFAVAVTDAKYSNETFEVGGPDALSFDEIIDMIAKVINKKAIKIHLPIGFMKAIASLLKLLLKKPPISNDQLLMLQSDNSCDISKIRDVYARNLVSFEDGLKKYLV